MARPVTVAAPTPALSAYDGQGRRFVLGRRLGRGGEGEVFEVEGQQTLVAKVLLPKGRTAAKLAKLEAMVAAPPAGAYEPVDGFPVLTWPLAVLHSRADRQGASTFLGYAMVRVQPSDFVPFSTLVSEARRRGLGGNPLTWDRMVLLALRLVHVVRTLHRFGYAVGDLNDRNVLVSRRLTPLLMDTDSFQVPRPGRRGHFPSVVGDAQYWAPELLDVDLATYTGSRVQGDLHALGVLLFQLFMSGWRPYQATGSAAAALGTPAQKAKAGLYPWDSPKRGVLEPPATAPSYPSLPEPVRRLFRRCLVDGHRKPARRPTADDWHDALRRLRDDGFQACPCEPSHVFGRRERRCPWCGDPHDRFTNRTQRIPRRIQRIAPAAKAGPAAKTAIRNKAAAVSPRRPPQAPLPASVAVANKAAQPSPKSPPRKRIQPTPVTCVQRKPRKARPRRRRASRSSPSSWPSRVLWLTMLTGSALAAWALLSA
jgi:DNA-binding helix-hairpin-helix protein with protein kinase domain